MLMRRMLFIFIGVVLVGGIYAAESPNLEGKIRDRIDLSNMDLSGLNHYFIGLCPLACALCLLSSCLSLFFSTFAVVSVPLLNRLIIIASPYITINDNTSGIPISIYPSMICLELDRITERMSSKSLKNLDQNSFLTAIPNDNFQKKCERCK